MKSIDPEQQIRFNNNQQFVLAFFEVQDSILYRKAENKVDRQGNCKEATRFEGWLGYCTTRY
jgi:hypothetical protein